MISCLPVVLIKLTKVSLKKAWQMLFCFWDSVTRLTVLHLVGSYHLSNNRLKLC
jgi:hypothetical protein